MRNLLKRSSDAVWVLGVFPAAVTFWILLLIHVDAGVGLYLAAGVVLVLKFLAGVLSGVSESIEE